MGETILPMLDLNMGIDDLIFKNVWSDYLMAHLV
jgi:hypothetical protein